MFAVVTTVPLNVLIGIALAIGLTLFVVIGLIVTNPKHKQR